MRVLLIGNYLADRQRSMQSYASLLENGLRARGHDVRLLRPPALLGRWVRARSPLLKWLSYADKFLFFRRELQRAASAVDVVHLCDHSNAMYASILRGSPCVITCHDLLAVRSAMGHFPQNSVGITGRIFQRLIARGLRRARSIICVSEKTRDDLRTYLGIAETRLHVVPNPLPWPYAPMNAQACDELLKPFGLRSGEPYFLQVGGDHWYKNRAGAVEIFAELRRMGGYPNAKLAMAGGRLTGELRALVRKRALDEVVVDVGQVSNEQMCALYSAALATLFPSLEEGFGWPILESQACACPVAVMNRPPMNEVAGEAAIWIDPARPEDAAEKISDGLKASTRLREDGLRNAATYTVERMLQQCEAVYREAAGAAVTRG